MSDQWSSQPGDSWPPPSPPPPPTSAPGHQYQTPAPGYPYAYAPAPVVVAAPVQKSPGLAVALELVPGFLCQTFGIGNLYAGNVGVGLGLMFGYWALLLVNAVLAVFIIGIFTGAACWIAAMILAPILAKNAAGQRTARIAHGYPR